MKLTDWLTYTDVEQLKKLNRFYGLEEKRFSKHALICDLLQKMQQKNTLTDQVKQLSNEENRFLQLLMLDQSPSYTIEELVAKGSAARLTTDISPRTLVMAVLKRGWLYPGYSPHTSDYYFVPEDVRQQLIQILCAPMMIHTLDTMPTSYRNEENLLQKDLYQFLRFLQREIVQLTKEHAIHKQQQKQIFSSFAIAEKVIAKKVPRFGFGRSYHLYPDRFALLYDYAFYKDYIDENKDEYLCLTSAGSGKINHSTPDETKEMYQFWLRLYRRPISQLPIIIRWIGLLSEKNWISLSQVYQTVMPWLQPFYYETKETLFEKVIQMLLHLGALQTGQYEGKSYIQLTTSGQQWVSQVSVFKQRQIEEHFFRGRKSSR